TVEIVDVAAKERNTNDRCWLHRVAESGEMLLLAVGDEREIGQISIEAAEFGAGEVRGSLSQRLRKAGAEPGMHPVHDQRGDGQLRVGEPFRKECGFFDGVAVR